MNSVYVIGEVGQNHNGNFEWAIKLIDMVALPVLHEGNELKRADAIKFTKRDLSEEMTVSEKNKPYPGENSFGETYGEHRSALEFTYEQHSELFIYAKQKGLDFVETICSPKALRLLKWFRPDYIKVASRDLTNIPLLQAIGRTDVPVILSTGMHGLTELNRAINTIGHNNISILHCVSCYPTNYEDMNLNAIKFLKQYYNYNYRIGFSDHTFGTLGPAIAVAHGARIIEKHITLDKNAKGSDHKGSMDLEGFWRVVRDIRNTETAAGKYEKQVCLRTEAARKKLERSICTATNLKRGHVIRKEDLCMLSPGDGLRYTEKGKIIGGIVLHDIPQHTQIKESMVKFPEEMW